MKKLIAFIILVNSSILLFSGDINYYQYENRAALSFGLGYDYYNMEIKDSDGKYQPFFTINGMTLNIKAEKPLKTLSGISIFMDTSFMIPETSYLNSKTAPVALKDSNHLGSIVNSGTSNFLLIDNNIGLNMLGTITPSFFIYYGGGIDLMLGHSYYKYNDGVLNQTLMYGYIGIGFFQTLGFYYEFTDNIAMNVGINTTYDLLIYNYQKGSSASILNKFEQVDAKGKNYLGKVMLTYNF